MRRTAGISPVDPKYRVVGHLGGLPTLSGALDLCSDDRYHDCSRSFFWSCSTGSGPEGTGWPQSWR